MEIFLKGLSSRVNTVVEWFTSILFISMVTVVGAQVVARYVFNNSFSWSEEYARIVFTWLVFLGTSIGLKRGSHLGLNVIVNLVPTGLKKWMGLFTLLVTLLLAIVILVMGILVTDRVSMQQTPALQISISWQYAAIPAGMLCMLLHLPYLIWKRMKYGHGSEEGSAADDLDIGH